MSSLPASSATPVIPTTRQPPTLSVAPRTCFIFEPFPCAGRDLPGPGSANICRSVGGIDGCVQCRVLAPRQARAESRLRRDLSPAELPSGWGVRLEPGGYQLRRRDDTAAFGHAAGSQSWKRFLHPPRERLCSATRTGEGFEVSGDDDEPPRYAFLGVRPCDLRAIAIQDRVLAQPGSR